MTSGGFRNFTRTSSSANFRSMRVLVLLALVALAAAVNLRLSSATLPRKNLGGASTVVHWFFLFF